MKNLMGKRILGFTLLLAICLTLFSGIPVFAEEPEIVEGATVTKDPNSPTGYTVTFVYYNPNATRVQLAGDLTLRDVNDTTNVRYQPEEWQTGRYHVGGTEFLRDMTKDENGYWSVSIPMHAGGLSYWYRVWDPTQGWVNKRIWDPASKHPRPEGTTTYRVNNNDVLDVVYVPYDEKQNDPALESRATYELPIADPAKRGTVQYIPYTTILGGEGYYLGIYLPPGYDPNREEPYKVVYLAHGYVGDETDWMIPGNAPNILDNMIARGEIEPTVVVTMGNHFTPNPSGGMPLYDMTNAADNLVQVILPFIEANFNVSNKPEGRAYAGFSMGGMTGGYVMRKYFTTFGYYAFCSGNPSLTAAEYDRFAEEAGAKVPFVFLGNGVFEGSLNAQNAIRDNFRARGIPSETAQVRGAHDMMTAGMLFTIFAREYLWKPYSPKLNVTTNANMIKKGDYFDISVSFENVTSTNAISLVLNYDQDKFEYAGNIGADPSHDSYIEGVTYLTSDVGNGSIKLTMMIPDYKAKDLVNLRFRAKENADLQNADNTITATANFAFKTYTGKKVIESVSGSTNFTTIGVPGDTDADGKVTLLDLSNIIDLFGVKAGDALWTVARFFDFNKNNEIDIADIVAIAKQII